MSYTKIAIIALLFFLLISCNCDSKQGLLSKERAAFTERLEMRNIDTHRAEALTSLLESSDSASQVMTLFLVNNMSDNDFDTLSTALLAENVEYALKAREELPWAQSVPDAIFKNDVLPYALLDETRDQWRKPYYDMLLPFIGDLTDPLEITKMLCSNLDSLVGVVYSTQRKKANQSPLESMESGLASCTGLSILLCNALRTLGIPSRLAGAPMWVSVYGNHSWSEVWIDGKWHFIEYNAEGIDKSWFLSRCAEFEGLTDPLHQVYATSFAKNGAHSYFPLPWSTEDTTIHAHNVTSRYIALHKAEVEEKNSKKGAVNIRIYREGGNIAKSEDRVATSVVIVDEAGKEVASGTSSGPHADMNDFLTLYVEDMKQYSVICGTQTQTIKVNKAENGEINLKFFVEN